jgi:uncharacterized protein YkwD
MTRLTALVGILLAALLLAAATASAGERHHRHHHGKPPAAGGQTKGHTPGAKGHAKKRTRRATCHTKGRTHRPKRCHRRKHRAPEPAPATPVPAPTAGPGTASAPTPAPAPAPAPAGPPASAPTPSAAPVVPAAGTATCADTGARPDATNTAALTAAVLCLVNQQRTGNGLVALTDNAALDRAAQAHSEDMVARSFFSHTTPDGTAFSTRILAAGYPAGARAMAENIAWGSGSLGTPAQVVTDWMNSPGHRANILNGALRESGIGIAAGAPQAGIGQAGTYTQDFGTP